MFNPTQIIIEAFVGELQLMYERTYGLLEPGLSRHHWLCRCGSRSRTLPTATRPTTTSIRLMLQGTGRFADLRVLAVISSRAPGDDPIVIDQISA